jgi:hypothetical protein
LEFINKKYRELSKSLHDSSVIDEVNKWFMSTYIEV